MVGEGGAELCPPPQEVVGGEGAVTMAGWVTGNRVRARGRGDRRTYVLLLVAQARYPNPGGPENHFRPRRRKK